MKRTNFLLTGLLILISAFVFQAQAQSSDAFAGKWDVLIEGTPNGDSKMIMDLERKDGKLTGTIVRDGSAPSKITRVEEKGKSLTVYFNSNGYDVYFYMEKKGDNDAEGTVMDMFDATAKRVSGTESSSPESQTKAQSSDAFAGKWDVLIEGTPNGDSKMIMDLERKDGKLTGTIVRDGSAPSKITRVEEKGKSLTVYFNSNGYDVYFHMEKKGDNDAEGTVMDMFDATAKRIG